MDALTYVAMDFHEKVDRVADIDSLSQAFSQAIDHFGYANFSMGSVYRGAGGKPASAAMVHTLPRNYMDHYISQKYVEHDSMAAFASTQIRPWAWHEFRSRIQQTPMATKIANEAAEAGLKDGLILALHDNSSLHTVMSVSSGFAVSSSAWERKLVHMLCVATQLRASELRDQMRRAVPRLSEREREVLKWMASGKNLIQTAEILEISPTTAKTHVENARRKMDAASTTQAVVAAIKSKQIIV